MSFMALIAMGCAGFAAIVWNGSRARELAHDRLVKEVGAESNPEAAINVAGTRVVELLHAIKFQADAPGRRGVMARLALEHARKELDK